MSPADKAARETQKAFAAYPSAERAAEVSHKGLDSRPTAELVACRPALVSVSALREIALHLPSPTVCDVLTTLWAFCRSRRHWTRVRQSPETQEAQAWWPSLMESSVTSVRSPTKWTRQSLLATFLFCFLTKDKNLVHGLQLRGRIPICPVQSPEFNLQY